MFGRLQDKSMEIKQGKVKILLKYFMNYFSQIEVKQNILIKRFNKTIFLLSYSY